MLVALEVDRKSDSENSTLLKVTVNHQTALFNFSLLSLISLIWECK